MNKETIKEFWSKHKTKLIIGGCVVTGTVVAVVLGKNVKLPKCDSDDAFERICRENKGIQQLVTFLDDCDGVRGTSTHYIEITGDEFARISNGSVVRDPSGKVLEVVGGILFGNPIGEVKEF